MTYQDLFNYLHKNYDITPTDGEMHEIERIVMEINNQN